MKQSKLLFTTKNTGKQLAGKCRGWQNTFMAPDARLITVHKKYNIQDIHILLANNTSMFNVRFSQL